MAIKKHQKRQGWFTLIYLGWVVLFFYLLHGLAQPQPQEVAYSDFLNDVATGRLSEVRITQTKLEGLLKPTPAVQNAKGKAATPQWIEATRLPGITDSELVDLLRKQGIKFSGEMALRPWWLEALYYWVLPSIVLALVYMWIFSRMGKAGGPLSFGKSRARIHDESSRFDTTFKDVAGVDEAKAELQEIVDFLKHPRKYARLGGRIPKGVLLVGPPGTGKTLLSRAVAGEAGVPFFSISGSAFIEMFVGVGAARVRDLFEQAKGKSPCIIFIDELDAIGKARVGRGAYIGHDEREQTLNQLLVEMDGFDSSSGVIIMGATNQPEVLDPALVRPGRFDRQIVIDRPDVKGREEILKVHVKKMRLGPDVDLSVLAARTPGMVGADLANIVNEAALAAARRGADFIAMRDFESAIDRVTLGFEKKRRLMNAEEKERVARHEAGHAMVALALPHADPVHRISIVPRSIGALGHTLQLPTAERYLLTQPELEDRLAVMLGGRAAEEIAYDGIVSTGASDDLERASELARQMITRFGMSSELGLVTYGRRLESQFLRGVAAEEKNYSERTAEAIDQEVRRSVERQYQRALNILRQRWGQLEILVGELVQRETLNRLDIEALLGPEIKVAASERAQPETGVAHQ